MYVVLIASINHDLLHTHTSKTRKLLHLRRTPSLSLSPATSLPASRARTRLRLPPAGRSFPTVGSRHPATAGRYPDLSRAASPRHRPPKVLPFSPHVHFAPHASALTVDTARRPAAVPLPQALQVDQEGVPRESTLAAAGIAGWTLLRAAGWTGLPPGAGAHGSGSVLREFWEIQFAVREISWVRRYKQTVAVTTMFLKDYLI